MTYTPASLRQLARALRDPVQRRLDLPSTEELAAALNGAAETIEELEAVAPWNDCPECPRPACKGPGTQDGEGLIAGGVTIRCAACGFEWAGTHYQISQALRADMAWREKMQKAQEKG